MSYIDLEGAIAYIKENQCNKCSDIGLCGNCAVLTAIRLLEKVPSADVAPVRHGTWVYNPGDNIPYCSECMMPQDSECNYCPSCGAKMDGGET